MNVALYLRLSDEDKNKLTKTEASESIKNQEMILKDFAKENNWQIYKIYNDEDYSGSDDTRPEFINMINDCKKGIINIVLCKTQARFARDVETIEKYVYNLFIEWNIRFITIIDRIDNTKLETRKTSQILSLTDQWYLEDVSNNIRETLKAKRKKGLLTNSFTPYGYVKCANNKNKLEIDYFASVIVKKIFNNFLNGDSISKIRDNLNKSNVQSPYEYKLLNGSKLKIPKMNNYLNLKYIDKVGTYIIYTRDKIGNKIKFISNNGTILINHQTIGNNLYEFNFEKNIKHLKYYPNLNEYSIRKKFLWSNETIKNILTNEMYIGNLIQFKTTTVSYKNHSIIKNSEDKQIKSYNTHLPIISFDDFYKVKKMLSSKTRMIKCGKRSIFSNIVYCDECSSKFIKCGSSVNGFSYLSCIDKKNKWTNCNNKHYLNEKKLYDIIFKKINNFINKYYDDRLINKKKNINDNYIYKKIESLEKNIEDRYLLLDKIYIDRINNIIDENDYNKLMNKYKLEKLELNNNLNILKKILNNNNKYNDKYELVKLNNYIINIFIKKITISKKINNYRTINIFWNI